MENIDQQFDTILHSIDISLKDISEKYTFDAKNADDKKIKKKLKKYGVESEDSMQIALDKTNKLFEQLHKYYEGGLKQAVKLQSLQKNIAQYQIQNRKSLEQKKMIQNLHNSFRAKYQDQIKKAQQIEKQQEDKRKAVIEELQQRIKNIQNKYQETGKIKIQKIKDNQTLKHQLSKLQPHLIAAQSLYEAQIKKKSIEVEIQMTTLKQKIQMMSNFKNMGNDTDLKLQNSKQNAEKINVKLKILQAKQEQHKLLIAKAHLAFEDYKKGLNNLKDILYKRQKQAIVGQQKLKKSQNSLNQIRSMVVNLDKEYNTQNLQLQTLKNLQANLIKQLEQ